MPVIEIPDVGEVEFPDYMSDQQMSAAAAKLHKDHQEPTIKYSGITGQLVNPKKAEQVSNSITGQSGSLKRSEVPIIGDLVDAASALPDVARGLWEQPLATLKGFGGGLIEGAAGQTDPITLATLGIPAATRLVKGAKAARAGVAAASKDLKPLEQLFSKAAPEVGNLAPKAEAAAARAVERRAVERTADPEADKLYERMREKFASGVQTGSKELHTLGEEKSALDASREAAAKVRLKAPSQTDDITRLPGSRKVGKNILRPDHSTFDLAQEAMPSGIKLKALKKIPMPTGSDELSKALRQRGHIAEAAKKAASRGGEAGFVTPAALAELPKAALQLRSASMLSGLALPMSIAGNIGAPVTAALESGSMKPIKELLRLPTNTKNVIKAFRSGSNPSEMAQYGSKKMGLNLPGRAIGAFDTATQDLLKRAGVGADEAKRLLLQGDNKIAEGLKEIDPHGIVFPFQKTPSNFFSEGIKSFTKPGSVKKAAITAGVGGAGYETGLHTDNKTAIKTGAAMSGVRGIPFLLGAGAGAMQRGGTAAARKAMGSFSPIQDMGITQMISDPKEGLKKATGLKPAFMRFTEEDPTRTRTRTKRRR